MMKNLSNSIRIILYIICFVAGINPATGQYGYNQRISFEGSGSLDFDDVLWDEGGVIVRGNIYVDSLRLWGLFVCRMDTSGTIVWHRTYTDSLRTSHIIANTPTRFIKTSDGGYLMTAKYFNRGTIGLIKFDRSGNVLFKREIPLSGISMISIYLAETQGSYFITGIQMHSDYRIDVFVIKTDLDGNQRWLKLYGLPEQDELSAGIAINPDSTITLGCQIRPSFFSDLPFDDRWRQPWLLTIDTTGTVVREWKGQPNDPKTKAGFGLIRTKEGYWGMIYSEYDEIGPLTIYSKPAISVLDSNFNLRWKREIGEFTSPANTFFDLDYDSLTNHLIVAGQIGLDSKLKGCIIKYTMDGEEIWRVITTGPNIAGNSANYMGGASISPSGSIYAAGYIDDFAHPSGTFGWILKITSDGCIDTLCTTTSILEQIRPTADITLYPNPATSNLNISWKDKPAGQSILECYTAMGVRVISNPINENQMTIALDVLPAGIFFYRIIHEGRIVKSGRVVKI